MAKVISMLESKDEESAVLVEVSARELTRNALNYAVALALPGIAAYQNEGLVYVEFCNEPFNPSGNAIHGDPIIDANFISTMYSFELGVWLGAIGELWVPEEGGIVGDTRLVAAMRCYVIEMLGEKIKIPKCLLN